MELRTTALLVHITAPQTLKTPPSEVALADKLSLAIVSVLPDQHQMPAPRASSSVLSPSRD